MRTPIPDLTHLSVEVASGDALDIRKFNVEEQISGLFSVELVVMSRNENIDFDAVVGLPASFQLTRGAQERAWTGIARRLEQVRAVDGEEGLSTYNLTIVPKLWLLSQRRNHRMFQHMSELAIVEKLLREWDIEVELSLADTYKKREYRVQYGETDLAFVHRMLEEAGISYFFRDTRRRSSVLVLTDCPHSAEARSPIAFRDEPTTADREHVTRLRVGQEVRPGRVTLRDHDFRLPPTYKLMRSATQTNVPVEERLERFDYTPGAFLFGTDKGDQTPVADDRGKTRADEAEAEILAQKRLDAERAPAKTCAFETSAQDLSPGWVVSFLDHPREDLRPDARWLVVSSRRTGTPFDEWEHLCEARSAASPYRPLAITPKPRVEGVESATVVGPRGEEIHTDEHGRVRVHFHWDRESRMDHTSSCWIHVSQPWAGTGYGGTSLPRVGQEVIVDFLGGDPDRPVVVGRVYTGLQKPPYKLPDNKTQSGWKSHSSPGGGGDNFNEVMFEDKKGHELLRMQAEKDLQKLVKHDERVTIGYDRTDHVGNDETLTVGNDRARTVGSDEHVTIGGSRTTRIGADEHRFVGGDQSETTGLSRVETVGVASTEKVGATKTLTIGEAYNLTVGGAMSTQVGVTATVTAGEKITIHSGASTITIDKQGVIHVSGTSVCVDGKGVVTVCSQGVVNVEGAATVNVKGAAITMN